MSNSVTGLPQRQSGSGIGSYQIPEETPIEGPEQSINIMATPPPDVFEPYAPAPWEGVGPGDRGAGPSGPALGGGGGPAQQAQGPTETSAVTETEAAAAPATTKLTTGEGEGVDNAVNHILEHHSPQLQALIAKAKAEGWEIKFTSDPDGGKSAADPKSKTVTINLSDVQTQGEGRPAAIVSLLSHEMGHVGSPFPEDATGRTREEFVEKNVDLSLLHEGEAALANLEARAEILASGGPDIGVRGGLDEFYQDVYDRLHSNPPQLTREQAIRELADYMAAEPELDNGTNKQEALEMYFGSKWDEAHSID